MLLQWKRGRRHRRSTKGRPPKPLRNTTARGAAPLPTKASTAIPDRKACQGEDGGVFVRVASWAKMLRATVWTSATAAEMPVQASKGWRVRPGQVTTAPIASRTRPWDYRPRSSLTLSTPLSCSIHITTLTYITHIGPPHIKTIRTATPPPSPPAFAPVRGGSGHPLRCSGTTYGAKT